MAAQRLPTYMLVLAAVLAAAAAFGIWRLSQGSRAAAERVALSLQTPVEKTDPRLVIFSEGRKIPVEMRRPKGIAVGPGGDIWVVGDKSAGVCTPGGTRKAGFALDEEPRCVTIGPDGAVYIGMRDHVEVYEPSGVRRAKWDSLGEKAYITSLSTGGDAVWVADAGQRVVDKCSLSGQVIARFGKRDDMKNVPGLVIPSPYMDVTAAQGGSVWVANTGEHKLELYEADGSIKRSWGKEGFGLDGFCGCCNPADFAVFLDGRFVTGEKGLPRVKVYSGDGKMLGVVAGPESFRPEAVGLDLAVTEDGKVLVLDPSVRAIRVFSPKGKVSS